MPGSAKVWGSNPGCAHIILILHQHCHILSTGAFIEPMANLIRRFWNLISNEFGEEWGDFSFPIAASQATIAECNHPDWPLTAIARGTLRWAPSEDITLIGI